MPHYRDGTEARVGDIVRGKGYNQRDETGSLKEIVAIVTGITEGTASCNLTLLIPNGALGHFTTERVDGGQTAGVTGHVIAGVFEYGQADHFVKV
jgi:hypothetical protein